MNTINIIMHANCFLIVFKMPKPGSHSHILSFQSGVRNFYWIGMVGMDEYT